MTQEAKEERTETRRLKFDGTINLGHIVTAVTMLISGITVWTQSQIVIARQDTRLNYVERQISETQAVLKTFGENQQLALRNQDKLTTAVEMITRK